MFVVDFVCFFWFNFRCYFFLESGGGVGGGVFFLSTLKRFQITFIVDKGHDLESVFLCKTNKYE